LPGLRAGGGYHVHFRGNGCIAQRGEAVDSEQWTVVRGQNDVLAME
jgi:hypothetical protein